MLSHLAAARWSSAAPVRAGGRSTFRPAAPFRPSNLPKHGGLAPCLPEQGSGRSSGEPDRVRAHVTLEGFWRQCEEPTLFDNRGPAESSWGDAELPDATDGGTARRQPSAPRRANLPLYLAAGGAKERVPLYTTEGGWLQLETAALVDEALRAKEQGFGAGKIKVGRPIAEDVARIAAVREAVGDGFEIFTDANQAFALDEAIRRAGYYAPLGIGWLEEPMPADDIDGHARLSAATTLPIAIGESLYSVSHFREYLQRRACSIVQVDVARIGGITPWLKTAHLAESFNVAVCPHFLMELHVSLACAVPNARWVEYIPQLDSLTTATMEMRDGHGVPSSAPGLGIAWDFDKIGAVAEKDWPFDCR